MSPPKTHLKDAPVLSQAEADEICRKHKVFISGRPGGLRGSLAWCDLSGLNLAGRDLSGADLTGALLFGADLSGAKLDSANLYGADLQNADLSKSSLRRADLRGACLRNANLSEADLFEADLRVGAVAVGDRKLGFKLVEHVNRSPDEEHDPSRISASAARSHTSDMESVRADFSGAILRRARLTRALLKQCVMTGADLTGADLSQADLRGADMRDVVLLGANTQAWDISKADLRGALRQDAAAQSSDETSLEVQVREHERWCATGGKSGVPTVFDGLDLRGLRSLRGYNLTAVSARRAIFYGLDMEGVQLQGARPRGTTHRGPAG